MRPTIAKKNNNNHILKNFRLPGQELSVTPHAPHTQPKFPLHKNKRFYFLCQSNQMIPTISIKTSKQQGILPIHLPIQYPFLSQSNKQHTISKLTTQNFVQNAKIAPNLTRSRTSLCPLPVQFSQFHISSLQNQSHTELLLYDVTKSELETPSQRPNSWCF